MQSIEEKIYEVFWDKNIARMINRADLFSFLKQYVNPGLLTRSSKSELVHDLKEYMTTSLHICGKVAFRSHTLIFTAFITRSICWTMTES